MGDWLKIQIRDALTVNLEDWQGNRRFTQYRRNSEDFVKGMVEKVIGGILEDMRQGCSARL